jgi:hypothetical protein
MAALQADRTRGRTHRRPRRYGSLGAILVGLGLVRAASQGQAQGLDSVIRNGTELLRRGTQQPPLSQRHPDQTPPPAAQRQDAAPTSALT